jgi:hypothetical protein
MRLIYSFLLALLLSSPLAQAQNSNDCNKLGAWLWYIDITGFSTHAQIADTLAALGVKRIYVKVADGQPNTNIWPELIDESLPQAYKARGIEVWGWSYNYPNNPAGQAQALYMAAQTGYEGFVVDVEVEFDGLTTPLSALFEQFAQKKQQAITDGHADGDFKLYCTTWGNPADHNFHVELIDPHVDGFMPQTYVEQWGPSFVQNLAYWIEVGNAEYATLGATKPLHHIVALEEGEISAAQINQFILSSGPETSVWRIPGGGVPTSYWQTWNNINWETDFCSIVSAPEVTDAPALTIAPNPAQGSTQVQLPEGEGLLRLMDATGRTLRVSSLVSAQGAPQRLDLAGLKPGLYLLRFEQQGRVSQGKLFVKNDE